jgi:uncharacterized protein with HEPN domain
MKDDRPYLEHILAAIQKIDSYTTDGRGAFMLPPLRQGVEVLLDRD